MRQRVLMIAVAVVGMAGAAGATVVIDDRAAELLTLPGARSATSSERNVDADGRVHLTIPDADALAVKAWPSDPKALKAGALRATAYQFVSRVFTRPSKKPSALGFVRRNRVLRATGRVPGRGCDRGAWYRLAQGGYVCSRDGFAISTSARDPVARQLPPAVDRALPFDYGKAEAGALRFHSIPTVEEEARIAAALENEHRLPEVVDRELDGIFLLALDRIEESEGRRFHRTVRGRYVREDAVDPKPEPAMHGELLQGDTSLPLAFVYGDEAAALYRRRDGRRVDVGRAERHARFAVAREEVWDGLPVLVGRDGIAVARERARLVSKRARPEGVRARDKWIHVDLDEQALVAYEGDRPVMATLVSSGKGAEFATPKGLFQIREKHISTTMRGADPDEGYYEVEEVPWTQFYHDAFALHGAYWHDDFGKTRSHGCTNIAPVDARWLFYWTEGQLPAGWNALRGLTGTWVHFTRERAPQ